MRVSPYACGNPVSFADVQPGETVLDVGLGVAGDLVLASERVGSEGRVIGVAMTDEAGVRAAGTAAGLHCVEIRPGDFDRLPVPDCSVDWVVSNCVLNTVQDKPGAFAEVARVLRPGGSVSIVDLVVEDVPDWVRRARGLRHSCVARAVGEADYAAGLEAAGLTRVEIGWRFVYDAQTIAACTNAEEQTVGDLVGRVWSTHIRATKPKEGGLDR